MTAHTRLIRLWNGGGIGIIIPCKSGVCYSNQTGGHACFHPEVEGVYVPLVDETINQEARLEEFFTGPKLQGWCCDAIDAETADFVDSVLDSSPFSRGVKTDRKRLEASHEAWVHVTLPSTAQDPGISEIVGFEGAEAILTWANSD
jgi:hypothetical protein